LAGLTNNNYGLQISYGSSAEELWRESWELNPPVNSYITDDPAALVPAAWAQQPWGPGGTGPPNFLTPGTTNGLVPPTLEVSSVTLEE